MGAFSESGDKNTTFYLLTKLNWLLIVFALISCAVESVIIYVIGGIKQIPLEIYLFQGENILIFVVPPGIELLKFLVSKVLINNTNFYLVKIKTIELAIFLISIISIFIAVIFLTVQRYGKGSIPPNSIGIKLQKTL